MLADNGCGQVDIKFVLSLSVSAIMGPTRRRTSECKQRSNDMKAAVWHGVKDVRVEDVTLKPLKANEVVVRVAYAGICGSDLH